MSKVIAIVAAHPDDEVLGCGGTAIAHARQGHAVHILIMAEGLTARDDHRDAATGAGELTELRQTAQTAGAALGAKSVTFGGFPDNRMDSLDLLDIVKCVERFISVLKPDRVYTNRRLGSGTALLRDTFQHRMGNWGQLSRLFAKLVSGHRRYACGQACGLIDLRHGAAPLATSALASRR
jgi:hypothetical protein